MLTPILSQCAQTARELLALGLVPLPVAPAYPVERYKTKDGEPLFTGKNPSYITTAGKPEAIKTYKKITAAAAADKLDEWFADPRVGVGTCSRQWLDIDLKDFDFDVAAMESAVSDIVERAEWVERTRSGGYRIAVKVGDLGKQGRKQHFHIAIDGRQVGQFFNGSFVVLAPTADYTRIKFGEPLAVATLADLGITAVCDGKAGLDAVSASNPTPAGVAVELERLVNRETRTILSGKVGGDRSKAIATAAAELFGWENLAREHGVSCDSADQILARLADQLEIHADRLARILQPINRHGCQTALAARQSDEAAVNRLMSIAGRRPMADSAADDIRINSTDTPGIVAAAALYSADYVRIGDSFYQWTGDHYAACDPRTEKARIAALLKRCIKITEGSHGEFVVTRPWATAAKVADAYEFALTTVPYIAPDQVNPPGVNLINGVLTMAWVDGRPVAELLPHSPDRVYTYAPQVEFIPDADPTHCERLLEALTPLYRSAVLRVFAAALDLDAVRQRRGRAVRALIFTGSGANGKDALREALTLIFGRAGITSATVDDFHAYDHGRRFNLATLAGSRINWASENRVGVNIDDIQSLKQLITGDPLISERKFGDGVEFVPRCIAVFSTNDRSINLTASLEAIASRYAIVPFSKTFVANPVGPNQLLADARFKYDIEWIKAAVCPAFLNILIREFAAIFDDGIDYSVFADAMEKNRLEANHLYRFALESGISEDHGGYILTEDLWRALRCWYEDEGVLKITERGDVWVDDLRPGDPWVRFDLKLKQRLQRIFPNIETKKISSGPNRNKRAVFGISMATEAATVATEATGTASMATEAATVATEATDAATLATILTGVASAADYSAIVTAYGQPAVNQAWPAVPEADQRRIAAMVAAANSTDNSNSTQTK